MAISKKARESCQKSSKNLGNFKKNLKKKKLKCDHCFMKEIPKSSVDHVTWDLFFWVAN